MESISASGLATVIAALGVAGCWTATFTGRRVFQFIGKPAASLAFLSLAFHTAHGSNAARVSALLIALVFSFVGDMALMGRSRLSFLIGLAAFLLGHVAFVAAFFLRGLSLIYLFGAIPLTALVAIVVVRWLRPHVPAKMRSPVIAYIGVISAMVACAIATHGATPAPAFVLAAVMFFVSDIAVARQQFVVPDGWNQLWGLPLYFGAQLIFAANLLI